MTRCADVAREFWRAYYAPLSGAEVLGVSMTTVAGSPCVALRMRLATGKERTLRVLSDPEGNAPGFLDGLDRPKAVQS